ncbi:MAG: hypothetical protein ACR2IJ_02700 [Fluviibacter sp.]
MSPEEKFKENAFYKEFDLDNQEWKVTTNEGKVIKSKKWLLKHEDVLYTEVTPHVPTKNKDSLSYVRSKSKTVITTKFKTS